MFFLRGSELQTLSAELGLESRAQFGQAPGTQTLC